MTDSDRRADEFVADLPEPTDRTSAETTWARLGMIVMVVGFVTTVVAVILSQSTDNPLDQSTQLTLAVAGLAAVAVGGVVFLRYSLGRLLRFWLLRILDEQHRGGR
jgi:hypothetical protein